ncbi:MAG: hypothetical protein WC291_05830, partial [Thermodesulfovibrionales bacterium]
METPTIRSGRILIYRLYDVAFEIDLSKVEELLQRESRRLSIRRKPFGKAFEFANPPVSFQLKGIVQEILGEPYCINVYCKAYDYGVISIILDIPVSGMNIPAFEALSFGLEDSAEMAGECRAQLEQVVSILSSAFTDLQISRFEEDYTVFLIEAFDRPMEADEFLDSCDVSRLLLSEVRPLAGRITEELLAGR